MNKKEQSSIRMLGGAGKNGNLIILGFNLFPVSPFRFCLYLRDKFESCKSSAPIEAAIYGVPWAHELAGLKSPTQSSMVRQILEASKRLLGMPIEGKQPLDVGIIFKVAELFNSPQASLSSLRICFIFVTAFAGLMRCDEVIRVTRRDVAVFCDHMTIFCAKRKKGQ